MPDTKETKVVSEYETTPEDTRELMRSYENDILGGLLAAASFKSDEEETHPVEIARNGVVLLKFRIHPLREEDYSQAILSVQYSLNHYDPSVIGYEWDDSNPRIQLEPRGERGYIEMRAIQKRGTK